MTDALSNLKNRESGTDLYLRITEGSPAKIRVVSTDPYIHKDRYGNTRFAFICWSHDLNRPMILDKGWGIAKTIQAIHTDDDYGNDITSIDLKISASGTGLETRYSVNVLPKVTKLEDGHIEEANSLDLDKIIKNGVYASKYNEGQEIPEIDVNQDLQDEDPLEGMETTELSGKAKARATADRIGGRNVTEEFDESDLPNFEEGNE